MKDSSEQDSKKKITDIDQIDQESILKEAIKNYMSNNHDDLNTSIPKLKYGSDKKNTSIQI